MLRASVPELPSCYEYADTNERLLSGVVGHVPGVVAIHNSRLVGFLTGWLLPDFRGQSAVYSPEWANGAEEEEGRGIYEALYTRLSAQWVSEGYRVHLVGLLAHDTTVLEELRWLGFSMMAMDGVRDLTPVTGVMAGVDIRRAEISDAEAVSSLNRALHRHLAWAPTFLVGGEALDAKEQAEWLASPANVQWLALHNGEVVAALGQGPPEHTASTLIQDAGTTSILSAFTREDKRNAGIATALLNRALEWGRVEGYERCAVDFEPMNVPGARFWMRHFKLVSVSSARYINPLAARRLD
jgi:GNAT superfamily N-acetyltransferase